MSDSEKAQHGSDRIRCDDDSAVTDWIIQYPETAAVFHRLGLEVTCAGISLASACQRHGLAIEQVRRRLWQAITVPSELPTEHD